MIICLICVDYYRYTNMKLAFKAIKDFSIKFLKSQLSVKSLLQAFSTQICWWLKRSGNTQSHSEPGSQALHRR